MKIRQLKASIDANWRLHRLHTKPERYALDVNGPWRITFEWQDGEALRVDLEQYH